VRSPIARDATIIGGLLTHPTTRHGLRQFVKSAHLVIHRRQAIGLAR
jgi:hypothetical protein